MPLTDPQLHTVLAEHRAAGAARDALVAAVAARQDGTIARRQLAVVGLGSAAVAHRVTAGRLHPLIHGVYAVGHPGIGRRSRWQAALLAAGPAGVLSHRSAAELWGIVDARNGPVDVTVPGAKGRRRSGVRSHSGRLARHDVERRERLPVTSLARTLLDLAEQVGVRALVAALDRAEARRIHHPAAVADVMERAHGRRGLRELRRALLIARPQDVLTRSELERRALRMIARHRLPKPAVNAPLHGYEIDLLWPERRLAVELDGRAHHGDAVALDRDHRRDATLMVRGLRVARFTWRQVVNEPAWVAGTIAQLLAAGARDRG